MLVPFKKKLFLFFIGNYSAAHQKIKWLVSKSLIPDEKNSLNGTEVQGRILYGYFNHLALSKFHSILGVHLKTGHSPDCKRHPL